MPPEYKLNIPPVPPPVVPPPATPPAPPAPPTPPPVPPPQVTPPAPKKPWGKLVAILLIVIVLIAISLGTGYAYWQKLGPFANPPFSEEHFIADFMDSVSKITTAHYELSLEIKPGARDTDAKPLVLQSAASENRRLILQRDQDRLRDYRDIKNKLETYAWQKKIYPASLDIVSSSLKDPTGVAYAYKLAPGSKDFSLTINFESAEAVKSVGDYLKLIKATTTSTEIKNQSITFHHQSPDNLSFSASEAEPWFTSLLNQNYLFAFIPTDFNLRGSASGSLDRTSNSNDSEFRLAGNYTTSDYSAAADVDFVKKGSSTYFRINKMPPIALFFDLSSIKGQWIKASTKEISDVSSFAKEITDQQKEALSKLNQAAKIADEEKLITASLSAKRELINKHPTYRYNLSVNKENLIKFYDRLVKELNADKNLLDYLKSDDFAVMYDYARANNQLSLWVDTGTNLPVRLALASRLVPGEKSTALKGKQINAVWQLDLTKLGQPIEVVTPQDAKPLENVISEIFGTSTIKFNSDKKGAATTTATSTLKSAIQATSSKR